MKSLKIQHFRALTCIAMPCVWAGTYPMIMEAFGKSHRKTVMLVKDFAWPICQMILICVVYFIRQWTNLHLCIGTICLLSLPFFLILPDSVRWLANNNQNSKVCKEIHTIVIQSVVRQFLVRQFVGRDFL